MEFGLIVILVMISLLVMMAVIFAYDEIKKLLKNGLDEITKNELLIVSFLFSFTGLCFTIAGIIYYGIRLYNMIFIGGLVIC